MTTNLSGYNFAYLDEQTKRMIRRAILKAVAIPGYQVPFGGREMPMPYGWGTGGIQLTASVIGETDVLKVIDRGGRHHQRGIYPPLLQARHRRGYDGAHRRRDADPDPSSNPGNTAGGRSDPYLSGTNPGTVALYRTP